MTDYIVAGTDLTAVANKIRSKGGTSAALEFPTEFIDAIGAISGGGSAVVQPLSVTENGTYNPPTGVDGYAPVTVSVSGGSDGVHFSESAPTSSDGADGDYWYVRGVAYPAWSFTPTSNAGSARSGGVEFTVIADSVSVYGAMYWARDTANHIGLNAVSDGASLAHMDVSADTINGWNVAMFDAPIPLQNGSNYVLWSSGTSSTAKYVYNQSVQSKKIKYVRGKYSSSFDTYPTSSDAGAYYGVIPLLGNSSGLLTITDQYHKASGAWTLL